MSNYSEHVDRRVLNGLLKKYTKDDDLYQDLKILPPDGHSAVLEILENTPNQRMSIADISTIIAQYNRANEYDKFSVLNNRTPIKTYYAVVVPDYVTVEYDFIISTSSPSSVNRSVT